MRKRFQKLQLSLLFALIVFIIMLFALLLVFGLFVLFTHLGSISREFAGSIPFLYFALVSLMVGTILAFAFSGRPLKPLRDIMYAADRIADGDYSVRLDLKGPEELRELSDKFNHMAEELNSVEMLRSDFISNFSHEFKTPIVSIRGFAKALKWDDLSAKERNEYLDIIISESERLTDLSTNVLYLSKIEKQSILTDKKNFNLAEQIRLVIALLDKKLNDKEIQLIFDSDEYFIAGNEEMLRQVWINLLDNALKFTPQGGQITIGIRQSGSSLSVTVFNEGEAIPPDVRQHIFDKFYQGDPSHATVGNGLGLAIAKKIIDLHGGEIAVTSKDTGNAFTVDL